MIGLLKINRSFRAESWMKTGDRNKYSNVTSYTTTGERRLAKGASTPMICKWTLVVDDSVCGHAQNSCSSLLSLL